LTTHSHEQLIYIPLLIVDIDREAVGHLDYDDEDAISIVCY